MALLLNAPWSPFNADTSVLPGSAICNVPGKYVTPFDSFVTLPVLLGKLPTMFGVLVLFETVATGCVIAPIGAVMLKGWPEDKLRIPPSCQRSTKRCTHPGEALSSGRPGPKGSS